MYLKSLSKTLAYLPNHELSFSSSSHSDSRRQHMRISWTKYAVRPDSNGSQNIRVGRQNRLQGQTDTDTFFTRLRNDIY